MAFDHRDFCRSTRSSTPEEPLETSVSGEVGFVRKRVGEIEEKEEYFSKLAKRKGGKNNGAARDTSSVGGDESPELSTFQSVNGGTASGSRIEEQSSVPAKDITGRILDLEAAADVVLCEGGSAPSLGTSDRKDAGPDSAWNHGRDGEDGERGEDVTPHTSWRAGGHTRESSGHPAAAAARDSLGDVDQTVDELEDETPDAEESEQYFLAENGFGGEIEGGGGGDDDGGASGANDSSAGAGEGKGAGGRVGVVPHPVNTYGSAVTSTLGVTVGDSSAVSRRGSNGPRYESDDDFEMGDDGQNEKDGSCSCPAQNIPAAHSVEAKEDIVVEGAGVALRGRGRDTIVDTELPLERRASGKCPTDEESQHRDQVQQWEAIDKYQEAGVTVDEDDKTGVPILRHRNGYQASEVLMMPPVSAGMNQSADPDTAEDISCGHCEVERTSPHARKEAVEEEWKWKGQDAEDGEDGWRVEGAFRVLAASGSGGQAAERAVKAILMGRRRRGRRKRNRSFEPPDEGALRHDDGIAGVGEFSHFTRSIAARDSKHSFSG